MEEVLQYIRGSIQRAEIAKAVMAEQVQQYNEEIDRLKEYLTLAGLSVERSQTPISDRRVSFVQSSEIKPGGPANPSFGGLSPVVPEVPRYPVIPNPPVFPKVPRTQ